MTEFKKSENRYEYDDAGNLTSVTYIEYMDDCGIRARDESADIENAIELETVGVLSTPAEIVSCIAGIVSAVAAVGIFAKCAFGGKN